MHRRFLISLLQQYVPSHEQDRHAQQTILRFVQKNPDCFERSLAHGHITASAWLLNYDGSRALLMHHKKLNKWLQLGGHCDGQSDVMYVALKEAQEESGITTIEPVFSTIFDLDIHAIPANMHEPAHMHYDIRFLLRVTAIHAQAHHNHESKELRWIPCHLDKLPTTEPSIVRMVHKWQLLYPQSK